MTSCSLRAHVAGAVPPRCARLGEYETDLGRVSVGVTPAVRGQLDAYGPLADSGVRLPAFAAPMRLHIEPRTVDRDVVQRAAAGEPHRCARRRAGRVRTRARTTLNRRPFARQASDKGVVGGGPPAGLVTEAEQPRPRCDACRRTAGKRSRDRRAGLPVGVAVAHDRVLGEAPSTPPDRAVRARRVAVVAPRRSGPVVPPRSVAVDRIILFGV